jgi:L-lactate dehydrogenase complex protein LldG
MNGRDLILGRIREALQTPAPRPHASDVPHSGRETPRDWLPHVGETHEEQCALFRANAESLRASFHEVASTEEVTRILGRLAAEEGWKRIATHRHALLASVLKGLGGIGVFHTDAGYDRSILEGCDAGLTTCEALVAQTGSVLVSSATNGGRALSVLPPHHIVLARQHQLVADLPAAFSHAHASLATDRPSMLSFITGPSRTGDIERILVLGAHGPKKLTILMLP